MSDTKPISYLIREDSKDQWTISKWEDGVIPVQVYEVKRPRGNTLTCNCPSGYHRKYCKHIDLIRNFIKQSA